MTPIRPALCRACLLLVIAVGIAGCGGSRPTGDPGGATAPALPRARPQPIEPIVGQQPIAVSPTTPVGDVHAHAPSLAEVKSALRLELVAVAVNSATYIDPLQYVTTWGRTDQGVDAQMPIGAPILAPGPVKILAIIPNWYAGQPLVYFELLNGPEAGRVQYVAEQITAIAPAGSTLQQGQAIARYSAAGTSIEYGWSTISGITLAKATTGYEEGQVTPAGQSIRVWLDSLGAKAGIR